MGTKLIVVVGVITVALTLLTLTLPPTTVLSFLGLDLTIIAVFRIAAPLYFVGFLLEVLSTWGRRLVGGRWGERIADFAKGAAPAFVYMVPAEIAYIVLFVAFAVNVPSGWLVFQVLFPPGLLLLPFAFNWRTFWLSVKGIYNWLKPQYRRGIQRVKASQIPWGPVFVETAHDFLPALILTIFGAALTADIAPSLFQRLGNWVWLGPMIIFLFYYFLKVLKWLYPTPPHHRNP